MQENANMPAWAEIKLSLTFPIDGFDSLTFREPNGEALEAIENLGIEPGSAPTIGQTMGIISALSGLHIDDIRKLNHRDIKAASEVMVPLLSGEEVENGLNS
jgi:hypothetical protein